jgi:hypothetical protein
VRGAAVFLVARTDVAAAFRKVAFFVAADAVFEKGILELGEKRRVAADKAGIEEGRLGLVILVREFAGLLSTRSGSYHMPGSCNPSLDRLNCSPQHSNVATGGMLPTESHDGLYRATGDLTVFMKPLYEADPELLKIQILFVNEGAGSTLQYPAGTIPPLMDTYTSQGCEWMVRRHC